MSDMWGAKWYWSMFFSGHLDFFPANYHSVNALYSSIFRSWYNRSIENGSTKGLSLKFEIWVCWVCYLTTLSVSRLHSVDNKTINEYRAVGGIRNGRWNRITWRRLSLIPRLQLREYKNLEANDPVLFQDTITKHFLVWRRVRIPPP
jgi:hypothetical protein